MKKMNFFATLFAVAVMVSSCGAMKSSLSNQAQGPQRPGRTLRTTESCIEMANAESQFLRAYGTATSYVEKTALNEAERDARNRLAAMIKTAVEGAASDYERNATSDLKKSAAALAQAINTQFVSEEVANTRIIKTDIYDLTDGSIQVYVCLEMRESEEQIINKLENVLEKDHILEIQFERDQFMKSMKKGLEEYKKSQRQQ